MPLLTVTGDPLLTQCQFLAFGHNAKGRTEMGDFEAAVMRRYPAPFSVYRRACNKGKIRAGEPWFWRESHPHLIFLPIRQSSVGATRLRFVQSVLLSLARDYRLWNLQSIAFAPLGNIYEWSEIQPMITQWLGNVDIPIVVYENYQAGIPAE